MEMEYMDREMMEKARRIDYLKKIYVELKELEKEDKGVFLFKTPNMSDADMKGSNELVYFIEEYSLILVFLKFDKSLVLSFEKED